MHKLFSDLAEVGSRSSYIVSCALYSLLPMVEAELSPCNHVESLMPWILIASVCPVWCSDTPSDQVGTHELSRPATASVTLLICVSSSTFPVNK